MNDKPPGFFEGTEMPTAGWWEALWPDPVGVLVEAGLKSDMDVIDLCSGDGWFTLQIAKLARHVVAIDIDPALLEIACHRLRESGAGNCDFVVGDAYEEPVLLVKLSWGGKSLAKDFRPPSSGPMRSLFAPYPTVSLPLLPRA